MEKAQKEKKQVKKRKLKGIVISDKMNKTKVIEVTRLVRHPKYGKYYKRKKNFKAHDEENRYKIGERVIIEECRPISKEKRWQVVKKIT